MSKLLQNGSPLGFYFDLKITSFRLSFYRDQYFFVSQMKLNYLTRTKSLKKLEIRSFKLSDNFRSSYHSFLETQYWLSIGSKFHIIKFINYCVLDTTFLVQMLIYPQHFILLVMDKNNSYQHNLLVGEIDELSRYLKQLLMRHVAI